MVVIFIGIMMGSGMSFLTFVAAFQALPADMYEAGRIDGIRNNFQELVYLTMPQMKPQLLFSAVTSSVSAFAISVKEAPKGFSLMKQQPMYYRVKIIDEKGLNNKAARARVSAYVGDTKESCEKTFTTAIQQVVQTGDENTMMVISFVVLIISAAVLFGYITVRLVGERREKRIEKNGVNVKFKKDKSVGEGVKLTFLKDKDPG